MQDNERIKGLILNYLEQNPKACDTIEGVVNWWIPNEDITLVKKAVKKMLTEEALNTRVICGNILFFSSGRI